MSKMGLHCPFGHLKHKLCLKERPGVKLLIWISTTKSWESDFVAYRWHATFRWKDLDKGYNFSLDLISIRDLHAKLWGPKIMEVPTLVISRLPFGRPGTKSHLDVGLVGSHKVYYKGSGGDFPQVQAVMSLVSSSCSWLVLTPKVLQQCINQLVAWFCAGPCEWIGACQSS